MQLERCYSTGVHNYPNYAKDARNYSATLCYFRITTHFEREGVLGLQSVLQILIGTQYVFFALPLFINLPVLPASPYCVHFRCFTTTRIGSLTSLLSDNRCSVSEFPQIFLPITILKLRSVFLCGLYFGRLSSKASKCSYI
jgi:hypothetical protein